MYFLVIMMFLLVLFFQDLTKIILVILKRAFYCGKNESISGFIHLHIRVFNQI